MARLRSHEHPRCRSRGEGTQRPGSTAWILTIFAVCHAPKPCCACFPASASSYSRDSVGFDEHEIAPPIDEAEAGNMRSTAWW